jgi:SAM-dependent methyltransferase
MAVTESDVVWAYRTFLGRDPENASVVRERCGVSDVRALCESFVGSTEFRVRWGPEATGNSDKDEPNLVSPQSVETRADAQALRQLWERVGRAWVRLGHERPFYSVMAYDCYVPARFGEFERQFWESGETEAGRLAGYLADLHLAGRGVKLADAVLLDYGCGVGRVAIPLAGIAKRVIGYDISDPHLAVARARAAAVGRTNFRALPVGDRLPGELEPCDVFYSRITLQHNAPPIIGHLIRRLIRSLRTGGIGVFQVPTYCYGYRFRVAETLRAQPSLDMEMHCYPQADIFSLVAEEGAKLIQVREDDSTGRKDLFISNMFVLTK